VQFFNGRSGWAKISTKKIAFVMFLAFLTLTLCRPLGHAKAIGNYDNNKLADKALSYADMPAIGACKEADKPGGDQCRQFVNCIIYLVGGQYPYDPGGDYQKGFALAGGTETNSSSAVRGDIIQYGSHDSDAKTGHLHTAIVIENRGNNTFMVVDANFRYDGMVRQHIYRPPTAARFWHMGTTNSSDIFTGTPDDGKVVVSEDNANNYVAAGGSLFWIGNDPNTLQVYINQMQHRYGSTEALRMRTRDIRAIEGSKSVNPRRTPNDNTFIQEPGSFTQYIVEYQHASTISSLNELDYLGGNNKAVMIPAGNLATFMMDTSHLPTVNNGHLIKAQDIPAYYESEGSNLYHADNMTVADCLASGYKYTGTESQSALHKVTASLIMNLLYYGHDANHIANCQFPADVAFYGPSGAERWYIEGGNPYTRSRYDNAFALRCWLGSDAKDLQISTAAINQPTTAEERTCPDNTYLRNNQTGQSYQFKDQLLHYVQSSDALSCLTNGHPEILKNIDQTAFDGIPLGDDASCDYEGKLLQAPSGKIYLITDGTKQYVANQQILACIIDRTDSGGFIPMPDAAIAEYADGEVAYCPYPDEMHFVQETGQTEIWRVFDDGTRQHTTALCQPQDDPRFTVYTVPAGELDGHKYTGEFTPDKESCDAI
jgi:hypothetical protein